MSAPSDGARADARKRLAAGVVAPDERIVAALSSALFPKHSCICEMYDMRVGCNCDDELVTDIATALAGVIADAKAEALREAAAYLRRHGAALFDKRGPHDARGAGLWDGGCAIDPDDGDAFGHRSGR